MPVIFWCCFVRVVLVLEFPLPTFQEHTGFSAVMLPGGESSAFLREGENGERPEGKTIDLVTARPGMEVEDPSFSGPSTKSIIVRALIASRVMEPFWTELKGLSFSGQGLQPNGVAG
jgi:hypothetical protein